MSEKKDFTKIDFINFAKLHLRGEDISADVKFTDLYEGLIKYEQFGYATEILLLKMEENERTGKPIILKDYQELARNVYKDTTLSSYFKFDKALSILRTHCSLESNPDNETLGLAGAIFKYKWKFDHQFKHLLESRAYYKRGYANWKAGISSAPFTETDFGYTANNYAYTSELIVVENLEQISAITGITNENMRRFATSQSVRKEVVDTYVDVSADGTLSIKKNIQTNEWLYATLAEAYFGLRQYDEALYFINLYVKAKNYNWKLKTFTKQLYEIASFQIAEKKYSRKYSSIHFNITEIDEVKQKECLLALDARDDDKKSTQEYESRKKGKLGIGLSGGGHRAALFHIGVLAGLAEKNTLKDIEVISCVSGGSIIGVHYYLKLKYLLETTADKDITQIDYIDLVAQVEEEYLKGIQENMRVMVFANFIKNFKMLKKNYSRTHRLGELYEELLYLPIVNKHNKEHKLPLKDSLLMSDLIIKPLTLINDDKVDHSFDIYNDNWGRIHKVPQLILNATTLNTGHNWQFTATWMGEPPTYISDDFDVKQRLRRMYYDNAPGEYKNFRLGYAVAASSGVPLLFEPLLLQGIYEGIDLQLVDGGVHDNQGVASILQQECSSIIISDGSSQMTNSSKEADGSLPVFYRADSILQERVREIQLLDLKARSYSSMISNLTIVHLKNGLPHPPKSWIYCDDSERKIHDGQQDLEPEDLLKYGVMVGVQKLISEIRTDLDSHNDTEAYALMYSGYQQISNDHSTPTTTTKNWKFKEIEKSCVYPQHSKKLKEQLNVSTAVPFKLIKLYKPLRYSLIGLAIIAFALIVGLMKINWSNPCPLFSLNITVEVIGVALIGFVANYMLKIPTSILDPMRYAKKRLLFIFIILLGYILTKGYLLFFNKLYNKLGRVK